MKVIYLFCYLLISVNVNAENFISHKDTIVKFCDYHDKQCKRINFVIGKDIEAIFTVHTQSWFGGKKAIVIGPESATNHTNKNQITQYYYALFDKNEMYIAGGSGSFNLSPNQKNDTAQTALIIPESQIQNIKSYIVRIYTYPDKEKNKSISKKNDDSTINFEHKCFSSFDGKTVCK